jgi:endonuclease/exonuclease/phosphatase family metal-dependent hydrolase
VFAVEFLELGLGNTREQELHAGAENTVGYHGAAILSRAPIRRPAVVRLESDGRWFDGERGERRAGGRIAVLGTIRVAGADVVLAAVHLESHEDPGNRRQQMQRLLEAIETYHPDAAAVIGGDLNAHSLGPEHFRSNALLQRALREDPERLTRPVPHEPLFALAESRGYDWQSCNQHGVPTQRRQDASGSGRGALKLDWFLCRGLRASKPRVIAAVEARSGEPLSDHDAIAVTVQAPKPARDDE